MNKHIARTLFCFGCLIALDMHTSHGMQIIRYNLVDGAAGDQNGATLKGFIEMSAANGTAVTASDIVGWEWEIDGHSLNSSTSVTSFQNELGALSVTPTEITIDFDKTGQFSTFLFLGSDLIKGSLDWANFQGQDTWYQAFAENSGGVFWQTAPTGKVVIATAATAVVPEPSTLALIGLGIGAASLSWRRRSKDQRAPC